MLSFNGGMIMWTRAELKTKAKAAFTMNYWHAVGVCVVLALFAGGSSGSNGRSAAKRTGSDVSDILSNPMVILTIVSAALLISLAILVLKIIVGNCLIVGADKFLIDNAINAEAGSDEKAKIKSILCVFKSGKWGNVTIAMFLKDLFVALWTLLLIIPGIIKSYEYRMVPFLLADDPSMNWKEAMETSKDLMNGNKWDVFVLDLSFIGWFILSAITFNIVGIFWTNPYYYQTCAELYITLLENSGNTVQ